MNRRRFLTAAAAASFALHSDTPRVAQPPHVPLSGTEILPLSGKAPTSMVVLLHGFGGNGEAMKRIVNVWAQQMPDTVFVLPDAPYQCQDNANPQSRQWFATRAVDADAATRAAEIRVVEPILNAYIDAKLAQYGLSDTCLALAGFSQGAMMALQTAPRRKQACAAVVAYGGMLADPSGLQSDRITRPPVLLAHGSRDNVVAYSYMAEAEAHLRRAGFSVDTSTYNIGHSMNTAGLRLGADHVVRGLANRCAPPRLRRNFGR